jgi:L-fuculose-phosphate aldolase
MDEADLRRRIVEVGRRLHDRFFVASNDGNISARLGPNEFLVTPTSVNKGDLAPEHLLKVDAQGTILSGTMRPTSEMKMHLAVYRVRPDVKAIVHAHPPAATGFAACRIRLDQDVVLPEVVFNLGRIGFAGYATPTTEELPRSVEQEIPECDALLMANHGAITVAGDVLQAFYRMEVLEMYARVRLVTKVLGEPKALEQRQVEELHRVRERQGWGPSRAGAAVDPEIVGIVTQVVLEVLRAQKLEAPGRPTGSVAGAPNSP